MALKLQLLAVVVAVAASCRPGLADPAVSALPGLPVAGLAAGFYNESCPEVEDLVLAEMRAIVEKDRTLGPALLRFMFHDCLVRVRRSLLLLPLASADHQFIPSRSRAPRPCSCRASRPSRARNEKHGGW